MIAGPEPGPRGSKARLLVYALLLGSVGLLWLLRQSWVPAVLDLSQPLLQRVQALQPAQQAIRDAQQAQLQQLTAENELLQKKLKALEIVAQENQNLRDLLDLPMPAGYEKLAATVILRAPHHWFESLQIDKGFEAGVALNQVVLNASGVVGKIAAVTAQTAEVQLISHPESSVACIVGQQKVPAMLNGRFRQRPARLQYLQNYARIQPDDTVLTSGLGGVYPPNLLLGTVSQVQKEAARPVPDAEVRLDPLEQHLQHLVVLVPAR